MKGITAIRRSREFLRQHVMVLPKSEHLAHRQRHRPRTIRFKLGEVSDHSRRLSGVLKVASWPNNSLFPYIRPRFRAGEIIPVLFLDCDFYLVSDVVDFFEIILARKDRTL